jgi:dTMP kinase
MSLRRGALIVFEGGDRAGKSTQIHKLADALRSRGVAVGSMGFPDRSTTIGCMLNAYLEGAKELDDRAVHLLFAANRWERASTPSPPLDPRRQEIVQRVSAGETLLVDRYSFSGVAFTAAKVPPSPPHPSSDQQGVDLEWCKLPEVGLPKPDVIFYLRVPPAMAAAREAFGRERYERADFQVKVSVNFDKLVDKSWAVGAGLSLI